MRKTLLKTLAAMMAITVIFQILWVSAPTVALSAVSYKPLYSSSDTFTDDFIKLYISSDYKTVSFNGKTASGNTQYKLRVRNKDAVYTYGSLKSDHTYSGMLNISSLGNGYYWIDVFLGKQGQPLYSILPGIPIVKSAGVIKLYTTSTNNQNRNVMLVLAKKDPAVFNTVSALNLTASQADTLRTKALQIIGTETDGYRKVKRIHDWVADNVYYDFDAFKSGIYGDNTAYGVYTSGTAPGVNMKAVCQGYAALSQALLITAGIPCAMLQGKIIYTINGETWSSVTGIDKCNHVWNAAYVSGRWVVMDVTWDSENAFRNNKYEPKCTRVYTYFDQNLDAISVDHRALMIGDETITSPKTPAGFKAVSASYNSIKLSWGAVSGVTGYLLYRLNSATNKYDKILVTAATSYTDKALTTGKTYTYIVMSYKTVDNAYTYSGYSPAVSCKPVPGTPGSFTAARAGSTSIKLSWAAVAGVTGYEIYRYNYTTGKWDFKKAVTSLTYTDTGLTKNCVYKYKVRAYKTMGTTKVYSAFTAEKSAKPY